MFFKKTLILWIAAAGCPFAALPGHADPFLPVPPASFLNYHVSTARGLSEEVAQDVVVRARLARHFGMSAPAVASYVRQNLVETTLTASQAGRYRVACISPSGREYFVSERLAAGTPVFALAASGKPILRLACGNPLVATLPAVPHQPVRKAKPAVLAQTPTPAPVMMMMPAPRIANQTFTPATPFVTAETGPVVRVAGSAQSLSGKGGGFLPLLFGAAGVGLITGHHGSSTPNTAPLPPVTPLPPITPTAPTAPITPTPPVAPPATAVPEPSPLLLFGIFGTVLVGRLLKSRPRRF